MAINSIWNNNSPMDYLSFLSTDPDNNTEDNEWLTHFQQLVQEKLSEMNEDKDSAATVNPAEEIAKWKENIYNKMKNGETEESFHIGGQSFSMREWDKLLDSFDKALEALQEAIEEEEEVKDKEMAETAKKNGTTRATACMDKAAAMNRPLIFAIGNAPTALIRLYELIVEKKLNPVLVSGVPVGFFNVVQSKELIMQADVPYIVARGRKGGSNIAACICNALLYNM